jgi:hypothetical protein
MHADNPTPNPSAKHPALHAAAGSAVGPTPDRYRWTWCGITFDFYRLCEILGIKHHAQAHALKKLIRAGRSVKSIDQDIDETIDALLRWKEMLTEDRENDERIRAGKEHE